MQSITNKASCVKPDTRFGNSSFKGTQGSIIGNTVLAQDAAAQSLRPVPAKAPTIKAVKTTAANSDVTESVYYLPQLWADFLSTFQWDWFITVTPDDNPHPEALDKLRDTFIHHLNQQIYGRSYWKDKNKGVFWAFGMERQRRGTPHIHGLIGGIPDFMSPNIEYNWLRDHGAQFSKIESYRPNAGAEYYMSKSTYAWKRGEVDLSATMKLEQDGTRVCGKVLQHNYCEQFANATPLLRQHLASFQFS